MSGAESPYAATPWSICNFSQTFTLLSCLKWIHHRQTSVWLSYSAACFGDILLIGYFNGAPASCAAKQKYHTLCENLRSVQFLPREIITFCAEIGMSGLEKGRGKKQFLGSPKPLSLSRAPELRSQVHSWQKGSLPSLRTPKRTQGFSQFTPSGTFMSKWHMLLGFLMSCSCLCAFMYTHHSSWNGLLALD